MPTTYIHLLTAVTALGSTAEAVADLLDAGGWIGAPNRTGACPVARYLTDVVPGAASACVTDWDISISTEDNHLETATPDGVAAFLAAFDDGRFPHLVDPLAVIDPDNP
jgi:hypothetical protein